MLSSLLLTKALFSCSCLGSDCSTQGKALGDGGGSGDSILWQIWARMERGET